MQRAGGVVDPGAPNILGKKKRKEAEKETRDFQPQDAADAAEGAQKAAHTPTGSPCELLGLLLHLANFGRVGHDARRGNRWPSRRATLRRPSLRALLGDAPRHAYADAQSLAQLTRIHPNLSVSAPKWNWFLTICSASELPSTRVRSKVEESLPNPSSRRRLAKGAQSMSESSMNPRLRDLIRQLGEAIHESVIESEQIAGVVQNIRRHGFDVMLMLEATIGLNDVTGDRVTLPAGTQERLEAGDEEDDVPFNSHDVNFLKSLRISVEGED